jgi:hypothetical protein
MQRSGIRQLGPKATPHGHQPARRHPRSALLPAYNRIHRPGAVIRQGGVDEHPSAGFLRQAQENGFFGTFDIGPTNRSG